MKTTATAGRASSRHSDAHRSPTCTRWQHAGLILSCSGLFAAFTECLGLWQLINPPKAQPGTCAFLSCPLDAPTATFGTAPIRVEGVFVHWGCVPRFAHGRWHEAKAALSRFGIHV
jgi:hypothetical protein